MSPAATLRERFRARGNNDFEIGRLVMKAALLAGGFGTRMPWVGLQEADQDRVVDALMCILTFRA